MEILGELVGHPIQIKQEIFKKGISHSFILKQKGN